MFYSYLLLVLQMYIPTSMWQYGLYIEDCDFSLREVTSSISKLTMICYFCELMYIFIYNYETIHLEYSKRPILKLCTKLRCGKKIRLFVSGLQTESLNYEAGHHIQSEKALLQCWSSAIKSRGHSTKICALIIGFKENFVQNTLCNLCYNLSMIVVINRFFCFLKPILCKKSRSRTS